MCGFVGVDGFKAGPTNKMSETEKRLQKIIGTLSENVSNPPEGIPRDNTIGPTCYGEISSFTVVDEVRANALLAAWVQAVNRENEGGDPGGDMGDRGRGGRCVTVEERNEYHMTDGVILISVMQEPRGVIRYVRRYPVQEARLLKYDCANSKSSVRSHAFAVREVEPNAKHIPNARKLVVKRTYQIMENDFFFYQVTVEWPAVLLPEECDGATASKTQGHDIKTQLREARTNAVVLYNLMQESQQTPIITAGVSLAFTPETCKTGDFDIESMTRQFIAKVQQLSVFCSQVHSSSTSASSASSSSDTDRV